MRKYQSVWIKEEKSFGFYHKERKKMNYLRDKLYNTIIFIKFKQTCAFHILINQ